MGFFLDSEYSLNDPRSGTFFLFLSLGTAFEPDLRRWSVFPFRSDI